VSIVRTLQNTSGKLHKDLNLGFFFCLLERTFKYLFYKGDFYKSSIYIGILKHLETPPENNTWQKKLQGCQGWMNLYGNLGITGKHILQIIYI